MQRPRVLASVGLDLYVMREVAAALQRLPSVRGPLRHLRSAEARLRSSESRHIFKLKSGRSCSWVVA